MGSRRSLFQAVGATLIAAMTGRGRAAGQETAMEGMSLPALDPSLSDLLRRLHEAGSGEKTTALEALVEELVRRQRSLDADLRALEAKASSCSCSDEESEESEGEECRRIVPNASQGKRASSQRPPAVRGGGGIPLRADT